MKKLVLFSLCLCSCSFAINAKKYSFSITNKYKKPVFIVVQKIGMTSTMHGIPRTAENTIQVPPNETGTLTIEWRGKEPFYLWAVTYSEVKKRFRQIQFKSKKQHKDDAKVTFPNDFVAIKQPKRK